MPEYTNHSNQSPRNPEPAPLLELEAIKAMDGVQRTTILLRLIEDLYGEVQQLKNRIARDEVFQSNRSVNIKEISGDNHIEVDRTEEQVTLKLDLDELRNDLPPIAPPVTVDRYQHCTDPGMNPDLFLPSNVADFLGVTGLVLKVTLIGGAQRCYYLIERNVIAELSDYVSSEQIDNCDVCEETPPWNPPPVDPPPINPIPPYNGRVVYDVECSKDMDGNLNLIVTYVNTLTREFSQEIKTNCCCYTNDTISPVPPSPASSVWRPCGATDATQDVRLSTSVKTAAPSADPVIQLTDIDNKCYTFVGFSSSLVNTASAVAYVSSCDDSACENLCTASAESLRISGYADGFWGAIQRDVSGCDTCGGFGGSETPINAAAQAWNGVMGFGNGSTWYVTNGGPNSHDAWKMSIGDEESAVYNDTGIITQNLGGTDYYVFKMFFSCAAKVVLAYKRAVSLGPCGQYTVISSNEGTNTYTASLWTCGQTWPNTITVVEA